MENQVVCYSWQTKPSMASILGRRCKNQFAIRPVLCWHLFYTIWSFSDTNEGLQKPCWHESHRESIYINECLIWYAVLLLYLQVDRATWSNQVLYQARTIKAKNLSSLLFRWNNIINMLLYSTIQFSTGVGDPKRQVASI